MKTSASGLYSFENNNDQPQDNSSPDEISSFDLKGFGKRFYREQMGEGRFRSFTISCKDSDLWIGVDPENFQFEIVDFARKKLIELRYSLES